MEKRTGQWNILRNMLIVMVGVFSVVLVGCTSVQEQDGESSTPTPVSVSQQQRNQQQLCQEAGGTWREFPNACVDSCGSARNSEAIACAQVLTDGCDCGEDKCWNGRGCEPIETVGGVRRFPDYPGHASEKPVTTLTPLSPGENDTDLPLVIADGIRFSLLLDNVEGARDLLIDSRGNLLVSQTALGKISMITLADDGSARNTLTILEGLNNPHGLVLDPDDPFTLYFAEEERIATITLYSEPFAHTIAELPSGGRHYTRSLVFGEDGRLYVSIGSSCDVCEEEDERLASVYVMDKDGSNVEQYAEGLRNAVFLSRHPVTGELWVTEMGRDNLGDTLPPDEINILQEGVHYGWPYCYGKQVHDSSFDPPGEYEDFCQTTQPSLLTIQAHSAPLGLDFVPGGEASAWQGHYHHDLLVAYHGSWNRTVPTGYKLVRFPLDEKGNPLAEEPEDFISGWLKEDGEVLGRPVDIAVTRDGRFYVSDDEEGKIYQGEVL